MSKKVSVSNKAIIRLGFVDISYRIRIRYTRSFVLSAVISYLASLYLRSRTVLRPRITTIVITYYIRYLGTLVSSRRPILSIFL